MLGDAVTATNGAKGVLLVPSFAIGRTQEIVYELDRLLAAGTIPHLPLYLDSPMAGSATGVYRKYAEYFDDDARAPLPKGAPLAYPARAMRVGLVVPGERGGQAAVEPKVQALGFKTKVPTWREVVELT